MPSLPIVSGTETIRANAALPALRRQRIDQAWLERQITLGSHHLPPLVDPAFLARRMRHARTTPEPRPNRCLAASGGAIRELRLETGELVPDTLKERLKSIQVPRECPARC
jgi:hypothetical protein